MSRGTQGSGFRLTRAVLLIAILVFVVLTIACFVWAAVIDNEFWQLVASALASAFLSIAVATLVTEVVLKPVFVSDMLVKVGLRERLDELGVMDVTSTQDVPWGKLLSESSRIELVLTRPAFWLTSHLDQLLDGARRRAVDVDIYLPEPDLVSAHVARNIGLDPKAYRAELEQAAADLEKAWKASARHAKSTISIDFLREPPLQDYARLGDHVAVTLPSPIPDRTGGQLVILFSGTPKSDFTSWVNDRWRVLQSSKLDVPQFTDRKAAGSTVSGSTGPRLDTDKPGSSDEGAVNPSRPAHPDTRRAEL